MQVKTSTGRVMQALFLSVGALLASASYCSAQNSRPGFEEFDARQKEREDTEEQQVKEICVPQLSEYGVDETLYSERTGDAPGLKSFGGFLCMFTRRQMLKEIVKKGEGEYSVMIGNVSVDFSKRKLLENDMFHAPVDASSPGEEFLTITNYTVDGIDHPVQNFETSGYIMMQLIQAMGAPPAN